VRPEWSQRTQRGVKIVPDSDRTVARMAREHLSSTRVRAAAVSILALRSSSLLRRRLAGARWIVSLSRFAAIALSSSPLRVAHTSPQASQRQYWTSGETPLISTRSTRPFPPQFLHGGTAGRVAVSGASKWDILGLFKDEVEVYAFLRLRSRLAAACKRPSGRARHVIALNDIRLSVC